ncbi:MAG: septation protein IspZ [Candidatus Pacebacteria bacterium]|nr:septation protein IspZ [Candidatus Paceibacterota bacterium]
MSLTKLSFFSPRVLRHIIFSAFLEFGPVLLFLVSTEYLSIYESTALLMVSTIISTFITYRVQKRVPFLALYIALITTIFGYLTINSHELKFIQMRDTLYDMTCALTLVTGMIFRKQFLKFAFQEVFPLTNRAWDRLTHLWISYFLVTALANEIVRNFFDFYDWLFFKGVVIALTSVFGLFALFVSFELKDEPHPKL